MSGLYVRRAGGVELIELRSQFDVLGGSLYEQHPDAFAVRDDFDLRGLGAERLLDVLDVAQRAEPFVCAVDGDFKDDLVHFVGG